MFLLKTNFLIEIFYFFIKNNIFTFVSMRYIERKALDKKQITALTKIKAGDLHEKIGLSRSCLWKAMKGRPCAFYIIDKINNYIHENH